MAKQGAYPSSTSLLGQAPQAFQAHRANRNVVHPSPGGHVNPNMNGAYQFVQISDRPYVNLTVLNWAVESIISRNIQDFGDATLQRLWTTISCPNLALQCVRTTISHTQLGSWHNEISFPARDQ